MAEDLFGIHREAAEVFRQADALSEEEGLPAVSELCRTSPSEVLRETQVAQPCIYAMSWAVWSVLTGHGIRPDAVAGHSLGEFAALAAAGAISFEEGFRMVTLRGRLMAEMARKRPGGMLAVLNVDLEEAERLCQEVRQDRLLELTNVNSPRQLVFSGEVAALEDLEQRLKSLPSGRAIPLNVSGPFHTHVMAPVSERLRQAFAAAAPAELSIPFVSNFDGTQTMNAQEAREKVVRSAASKVLWWPCLQTLLGQGITRFVEVGPGKVLTGLVTRHLSGVEAKGTDTVRELGEVLSAWA